MTQVLNQLIQSALPFSDNGIAEVTLAYITATKANRTGLTASIIINRLVPVMKVFAEGRIDQ